MRKLILSMTSGLIWLSATASIIDVPTFNYSGPMKLPKPFMIDSVDVNSAKFDISSLVANSHGINMVGNDKTIQAGLLPGCDDCSAIHMLQFTMENGDYTKGSLKVEGLKNYALFVDGKKSDGNLKLTPATHNVVIKYLSEPGTADSIKVSFDSKQADRIKIGNSLENRLITLDDVAHGKRISSATLSPDGSMMLTCYYNTVPGGGVNWSWKTTSTVDGSFMSETNEITSWMPKSNLQYRVRYGYDGNEIITIDPKSGKETTFAKGIPSGQFTISPDESYLIYTEVKEGPRESDVYQVINPEDRQPGWRNRTYLSIYDIQSGMYRPLTFGHHSSWLNDISDDGSKILVSSSRNRFTQRPTRLTSIYLVDPVTLNTTPIVKDDGFITSAQFSPDASKVLVIGSPEAFESIGKNVPEGRTPSNYDYQLFMVDLADMSATPLTRDFAPSVSSAIWSKADGMIYFKADDDDLSCLFKLDPTSGKITKLRTDEDLVNGFSLPKSGRNMAWFGQGASNSDRLYVMDLKSGKSQLRDNPSGERLADVKLGEVQSWNFLSSRGDSIHTRFYLPPNFDPEKKYPLIVNYYGGCTPTSRNFESRYPHHVYAANGYIVLVINPSGAIGRGQEFSSRHVNTAGNGPAEDIVEGTTLFCQEHPFVNKEKIGCIGASYGGFMTQYLQTITDIFAAAISHAGISDHTSYWGEGYWGYSYSETSMANSYPWSDTDLYVKQSPLYNADKIHTPLLFLHGDKDNNVPVGESIQMFTALKLLGRETAFVAVSGEDHHILDYNKRYKWQDTIFAWFEKYLKDDPTWWDELYSQKSL